MRSGLEVLAARGFDLLKGRRVGLVANHTAVDRSLRHAVDLMADALGEQLVVLFAPEHGIRGAAQDMISVDESRDARTGLPVVSLYGSDEASLTPPVEHTAKLDVVVFDVQDVGSRYYTFQATLALLMTAARERGFQVVVLDRPNPIGGHLVEGNLVAAGFESFVGIEPIAVRHGMTMGELAHYYAKYRGRECDFEVVAVEGLERSDWWDATALPWVYPSPNMPTVDTALVYPGVCLIEGTNLSEGRGTTRPFELVGAPWLDGWRLRRSLELQRLPGVAFREAAFKPTFQKHAGQICEGVEIYVTDREAFLPFRTGLALVCAARSQDPEMFDWRREPYEFVTDRLAFDLLVGNDAIRRQIEAGTDLDEICASWGGDQRDFLDRRSSVLIYG